MKKGKLLIIYLIIMFSRLSVYAEELTCDEVLVEGLVGKINQNILGPLKIIAPILLLVLTTIDFSKVVFSDNKDGMNKAWKNFGKRTVATIIIFFAKNIVAIIYGFISGVGLCTGF